MASDVKHGFSLSLFPVIIARKKNDGHVFHRRSNGKAAVPALPTPAIRLNLLLRFKSASNNYKKLPKGGLFLLQFRLNSAATAVLPRKGSLIRQKKHPFEGVFFLLVGVRGFIRGGTPLTLRAAVPALPALTLRPNLLLRFKSTSNNCKKGRQNGDPFHNGRSERI